MNGRDSYSFCNAMAVEIETPSRILALDGVLMLAMMLMLAFAEFGKDLFSDGF